MSPRLFHEKDDPLRCKHIVLGRDTSYFVNKTLWLYKRVLWFFFITNRQLRSAFLCVTNCAPLLANMFVYSCEAYSYRSFSRKTIRSLVFCVIFCRSVFVLLSVFFWSFSGLPLVAPLVSSDFSQKCLYSVQIM